MFLIDRLAEERIQQSINQGELDNLPASGEPLQLDDNSLVPQELRAAYRLLKNAGFVPAEIQWRAEIADLESLLTRSDDDSNSDRVRKRLLLLRLKLAQAGKQDTGLLGVSVYRDRLLAKLSDSGN